MSLMEETTEINEEAAAPEIDSKYRLIILAAKRSKQLQRGAQPRIDIGAHKHKNTSIALEEVMQGRVKFSVTVDEDGEGTRAIWILSKSGQPTFPPLLLLTQTRLPSH